MIIARQLVPRTVSPERMPPDLTTAADKSPGQRPSGSRENLPGVHKAAILLLALGEREASQVMSYLTARQVQTIGTAMTSMSGVERQAVLCVLQEFLDTCENSTSLGVGANDYVRNVLVNALGAEKAKAVIDRILGGPSGNGLEAMKWLDARSIAEILKREHPQIAAMVLSFLDRPQAAEVLTALPENTRADLIMRVAMLSDVQPAALEQLDAVIAEQFVSSRSTNAAGLGGLKVAAEILNLLEPSKTNELIKGITAADAALAANIEELMFVFDDLIGVDDRGFQELLRRVPGKSLVLAMKTASEELQSKIFKNMSQRAAEMLRDDLANLGPVRLSEVEAAQKEILMLARQAADEGAINLGNVAGETMV